VEAGGGPVEAYQLRKSSVIGLIIGLATLVWGTTRLAQAGLFTMGQVWNVPGPLRPGFLPRLARSLLFLVLLALVVIATSLLAGLATYGHHALAFVMFAEAAEATVNAGMYFVGFRILTPRGVPSRDLAPGAVAAGIGWTALQVAGAYLIHHYLHSDSVYGVFATVLGLVAWLYLAAQITVYCAEINVVLARRLWPRSIIQPPLTEADRASLALQALEISGGRSSRSSSRSPTASREPRLRPPRRGSRKRSPRPLRARRRGSQKRSRRGYRNRGYRNRG
jgi:uncharacterized BrkB/YihY/UPF0761 family membrane protein